MVRTDKEQKRSPQECENYAIIIGRQFGSGGRHIGKMVASALGIAYYDAELLAKAAKRIGMSEEVFKEHDEKKPSIFRTLLQGAYGIPDNFHSNGIIGEQIYNEQSRVIREICKEGPCVIVGRTADIILKGNVKIFSIFLHSPLGERARKIFARGEAGSYEEAVEIARSNDKKREGYYNYYAGEKRWGVATNYHLTIDTSELEDECVTQIITDAIRKKIRQK